MRFGELRGLTSLPIHRVRDQFRYEEVLTVLPVREVATSRETLFVATRSTLALVMALRMPQGQWMTRWAPWDEVSITIPEESAERDVEVYRLAVAVGRQQFLAQLHGEPGRRALRDFVVAFRTAHPTRAPG